MVNYYSGFFISLVLHLALILSLTNLFKIKDLYSLNAFEPMPVYLVYENKGQERNIKPINIKIRRIEDKKVQKSLEELGLHCEDFHVLGVFEADPVRENKS